MKPAFPWACFVILLSTMIVILVLVAAPGGLRLLPATPVKSAEI